MYSLKAAGRVTFSFVASGAMIVDIDAITCIEELGTLFWCPSLEGVV